VTDPAVAPTLSAVVTCYRDAPALRPMHARLTAVCTALGVDYEIIFVNDASPDDAGLILAELTSRDPHVLAVEHSRNFGSQSAFLSGMQLARGDAVVLLDGDLQDPPELIAEFYARWRQGHDVVYGRRARREGSAVLALLVRGFYRLFRGLSEVPMPLYAGDFALMDRRVVEALLALPETDQFLRGLRAWVGFRQTGVDYLRPRRAFGRSTHGFWKNVWWARKGLYSFTAVPIEGIGYGGVTLAALALLGLGQQGIAAWLHPEVPRALTAVVLTIALFGSLQLCAIAVVGEYVIKILEEAKRRPRFIRTLIRQGSACLTTPAEIDRFQRARRREAAARLRPVAAPPAGAGGPDGT